MTGVGGSQGQFLGRLFPLVDRDRDGKMTLKELDAFASLYGGARDSGVTVAVAEQGRALFQLLDANRDGRLGLRELRTAWERLAPVGRNGDGFVSPQDRPRQLAPYLHPRRAP